jgi:hypothetical protein
VVVQVDKEDRWNSPARDRDMASGHGQRFDHSHVMDANYEEIEKTWKFSRSAWRRLAVAVGSAWSEGAEPAIWLTLYEPPSGRRSACSEGSVVTEDAALLGDSRAMQFRRGVPYSLSHWPAPARFRLFFC